MPNITAPPLPALQIGEKVAQYPIIQGGMGVRISGPRLAAAVANAGGVGIISSVGLGLQLLQSERRAQGGQSIRDRYRIASRDALTDANSTGPSPQPEWAHRRQHDGG